MKLLAPLSISFRRSRHLLVIQSLAHVAAAGAVLAATLPSWLTAGLLLLVGASLALLRRTSPVASLVLHGDGRFEAVGADGAAREAIVHPHTLALPFLVVLLYREHKRLRALTLLADQLAAEDFRQLRIWLRWRSSATNPP